MKFRIIAITAVFIAFGAACATTKYLSYRLNPKAPAYSGSVSVKGIEKEVSIVFDANAVAHINAQTADDAYFALGYLHARERLFQMELLRRICYGTLSELFGNRKSNQMPMFEDTLATDKWLRVLGFGRIGEETAPKLDDFTKKLIGSYIAGVNEYVENGKMQIEFELRGQKPQKWTIANVIAVARLMSWDISTNMTHELVRFLLAAELGDEVADETYPPFNHPGPYIIEPEDKDYKQIYKNGAKQTNSDEKPGVKKGSFKELFSQDPAAASDWAEAAKGVLAALSKVKNEIDMMIPRDASNNWAVDGTRSESGKPILANDPHLDHMAPGVFYGVHIKSPSYDAIGVSMPGTPAIELGRNKTFAWAATTTFADTQDVYLEKIDPKDPAKYLTKNGSEAFKVRVETVKEKMPDGTYKEHKFEGRFTARGVILNDGMTKDVLQNGKGLLALKTTMENQTGDFHTMSDLLKAKYVADFNKALAPWGIPVQNWLAVDWEGNVSYYPAGKVPIRRNWDGTKPVPGWTGEYEWDGFIPFDEIPQLDNPKSGLIVTANNKILPTDSYPYPYAYDCIPGYRAQRIKELLLKKPKLTAKDMAEIQTDVYVVQADRLLPPLFSALDKADMSAKEKAAYDALKNWDKYASLESVGASIFFASVREAWDLCLKDKVSKTLYDFLSVAAHSHGLLDRLWADVPGAKLFDAKATEKIETRDDVLTAAFKSACANLEKHYGDKIAEWKWGKMHFITYEHAFGDDERVGDFFNVGPIPMPGYTHSVWAAGTYYKEGNKIGGKGGPVFRHVVDMAKPEESGFIVDLGQSGWAGTKFYANAQPLWTSGKMWSMTTMMSEYAVGAIGTLNLQPAK